MERQDLENIFVQEILTKAEAGAVKLKGSKVYDEQFIKHEIDCQYSEYFNNILS